MTPVETAPKERCSIPCTEQASPSTLLASQCFSLKYLYRASETVIKVCLGEVACRINAVEAACRICTEISCYCFSSSTCIIWRHMMRHWKWQCMAARLVKTTSRYKSSMYSLKAIPSTLLASQCFSLKYQNKVNNQM